MVWKPLPNAFAFAVIAPAIGIGLFLAFFSALIADYSAFSGEAFWELTSSIYIIGAPPMFLTGLLVGLAARRGARLPTLTMQSAIYGALFGTVSMLFWSFLGALASGPGFDIIAAFAAASAAAGFGAALIVALFSLATGGRTRRVGE